jgi:hypothetical protein
VAEFKILVDKKTSSKFFKLEYKIKLLQDILKSHDPVLFYALLFASSCRPKRNHPAAETECYADNSYIRAFDIFGCTFLCVSHSAVGLGRNAGQPNLNLMLQA